MNPRIINEKMAFRLHHCDNKVKRDVNSVEGLKKICDMIENGAEHTPDLLWLLASYLEAKAMSHWFHGGDIATLKNLCYNILKLKYIGDQAPYHSFKTGYLESEAAFFILSDHKPLLDWFSERRSKVHLDEKKADIIKDFEYNKLQKILLWQGKFDVLGERAERFLANPPTNKVKSYIVDQQFFLALAKGDVQGMESVVRELMTPRRMNYRKELESTPYSESLVASSALIYSKLAYRHGYELDVESPNLPKEWLPIEPLDKYEDEFEFMKAYSI